MNFWTAFKYSVLTAVVFTWCSTTANAVQVSDKHLKEVEQQVFEKSMEHKKLQAQATQISMELSEVNRMMIQTAKNLQNNEEKLSDMERQLVVLEKKLAETDLSKYVKSPREQFVIASLQYRNFNTNYALDMIRSKWENMFARMTACFYFNEIRKHYETGMSILSMDYKCLIDKHRNIEALPVDDEKHARKILKKKKDKINVPVKRKNTTLKAVQPNIVEKFVYGIKFNGCCMITFENEHEQEIFLKGVEMASIIKDYKKIHIKSDAVTEVE